MNWFAVSTGIMEDKSIGRMASELKKDVPTIVGHVIGVLAKLPENAPNGVIDDVVDLTLEQWAGWRGKAGAFATSFRAHLCAGDQVRSWEKWNGSAMRQLHSARERMRSAREKARSDRETKREQQAQPSEQKRERFAERSTNRSQNGTRMFASNSTGTEQNTTATASPDGAAAAVVRDGGGVFVDRVRESVTGIPHAEEVLGALRASRHPDALAAEFCAMVDGMRGKPVTWALLCRGVQEAHAASAQITPASLRAFVRRVASDASTEAAALAPASESLASASEAAERFAAIRCAQAGDLEWQQHCDDHGIVWRELTVA